MKLPFTKMQALGNDFVVLDFVHHPHQLRNNQYARIADRRFGIGCDQILIVEPTDQPEIDFRYRIYNADGSEVGQCGNGARCFVEYVRAKGLTDKRTITVVTSTSVMQLQSREDGLVTVDMGRARFAPEQIPFVAEQQQATYELELEEVTVTIAIANVGNPHAVIVVDDISTAPVEQIGRQVESHTQFPERVNVGFMQCVSRSEINLRVFERGAGETLACGSGACAAVAAGQELGLLDTKVEVNLTGGGLSIMREGSDAAIMMTGPANFSFDGEYYLE